MIAIRWVCVAGLLAMWTAAGAAQEAARDGAAEAEGRQEVASESDSAAATAAGEAGEAGVAEQSEAAADEGVTDTGAVGTGGAGAFPEIAPLDELFVPSQNIRADEPVTFPVDF